MRTALARRNARDAVVVDAVRRRARQSGTAGRQSGVAAGWGGGPGGMEGQVGWQGGQGGEAGRVGWWAARGWLEGDGSSE